MLKGEGRRSEYNSCSGFVPGPVRPVGQDLVPVCSAEITSLAISINRFPPPLSASCSVFMLSVAGNERDLKPRSAAYRHVAREVPVT